MIIAGITGEIGSGKTTLADYLTEQSPAAGHWESWQIIAEIADHLRTSGQPHPAGHDIDAINEWIKPLPEAVAVTVHRQIDYDSLRLTDTRVREHGDHYRKLFDHLDQVHDNPGLQRTKITAANKELFRPLLQWLGGYLIEKSDAGLWYEEILRRIAAQPGLDLATIGGVRFPRESELIHEASRKVLRISRPNTEHRDPNDLTERHNQQVETDSLVVNNGTLEQLRKCAGQILADLRSDELVAEYQASSF